MLVRNSPRVNENIMHVFPRNNYNLKSMDQLWPRKSASYISSNNGIKVWKELQMWSRVEFQAPASRRLSPRCDPQHCRKRNAFCMKIFIAILFKTQRRLGTICIFNKRITKNNKVWSHDWMLGCLWICQKKLKKRTKTPPHTGSHLCENL